MGWLKIPTANTAALCAAVVLVVVIGVVIPCGFFFYLSFAVDPYFAWRVKAVCFFSFPFAVLSCLLIFHLRVALFDVVVVVDGGVSDKGEGGGGLKHPYVFIEGGLDFSHCVGFLVAVWFSLYDYFLSFCFFVWVLANLLFLFVFFFVVDVGYIFFSSVSGVGVCEKISLTGLFVVWDELALVLGELFHTMCVFIWCCLGLLGLLTAQYGE